MMPESAGSIFNRKATAKLRNPDDLELYIRVTNPSVWAVLGACIFLLAGLLAWGVFGSVTTSVSAKGAVVEGNAVCFLAAEDVGKVHQGDGANFGGEPMKVESVSSVPYSRDEARSELGSDYLASTLMPGDWAYQVIFSGDVADLAEAVPQTVGITVERIAPIALVLKN